MLINIDPLCLDLVPSFSHKPGFSHIGLSTWVWLTSDIGSDGVTILHGLVEIPKPWVLAHNFEKGSPQGIGPMKFPILAQGSDGVASLHGPT